MNIDNPGNTVFCKCVRKALETSLLLLLYQEPHDQRKAVRFLLSTEQRQDLRRSPRRP